MSHHTSASIHQQISQSSSTINLVNIDLKYADILNESLARRVDVLGPHGMHMYMHNPYYSCFSKGHAKFAVCEYNGFQYLVLAKYVNMFGKIYNRLVGVPFCNNKEAELDFLQYLIREKTFADYQFNDGEIEYYGLNQWFTKFTLNNLDYYNNAEERWSHIDRSEWKKRRRFKQTYNQDNFKELTTQNLPEIEVVFNDWAQWKKERGSFSEKFFRKFFKAIADGTVSLDTQYKLYGYYHEDRLASCEVLTQNNPQHWRAEMLFWTTNVPYEVYHHVTAFAHYMRIKDMISKGVKYYYVAGSRDGVNAKTGVLHHKSIFEVNSIKYYKAEL